MRSTSYSAAFRRLVERGPALLIVLISLAFVSGCVSTKKRYEKGVKLEEQGNYRQAVSYYLAVLSKEPGYEDAKERLRSAATKVVDEDWATAKDYDAAGQSLSAYERYRAIEQLISQCEAVDVFIDSPDGLADSIDSAEEDAFAELLLRAERSADEGKYARSIDEYARARQWPNITPDRERTIDESVAGVQLAWGRNEFDREKFGAAFDHAAETIAIVGIDHQLGQLAAQLQESALSEGTRLVAFVALASTDEVSRSAPRLFEDDLNDVLLYDFWAAPPPFIATADPIVVRRELRRVSGRGNHVLSRGDAIEIGRSVDADYVFAGEISRYVVEDKKVKEDTKRARTRGRNPQDTTYVLRRFTQEKEVRVSYRIYDVRRRNVLDQGNVSTKQSHEVERGVYRGDYQDLDLTGREYAYFDPQEFELQDQALDERIADELAQKLSNQVFDRILRGLR